MEELFETFDDLGEPLGLVARDVVHASGLWHRASNVFLFRSDGRLVIQRRQLTKDVCPGAWDLSVAEHLKPGEGFEAAAVRGLREELDLHHVELEPVGDIVTTKLEIPGLGIKDYELQQCFRAVSDAVLHPQADEVAEVRLVKVEALKRYVKTSPDDFTPWFLSRAHELGFLD